MSIVDRITKVLEALKTISWDAIIQLVSDILDASLNLMSLVGQAIALLLEAIRGSTPEE